MDRSSIALREPTASAIATCVALLERTLPPLQTRLRQLRIQGLATRLARITNPGDGADSDSFATFTVLLLRIVNELQVELAELDAELDAHTQAYARAATPASRRRVLEQMIDATAASSSAAWADRRALRRHLDLDALRERFDLQRERASVEIELGLMALGPSVTLAVSPEQPSDPNRERANRRLITDARAIPFLLDQLTRVRRWPGRLACVESLEALIHALGPPEPGVDVDLERTSLRERLTEIARDPGEHEWVQARAIGCLRVVDLRTARASIRDRLGLGSGHERAWPTRDFLVRRLLVAQLCDHLDEPDDVLILTQALARGDPSEFVRIAHARALIPLAPARPEVFAIWAQHLTRVGTEAGGGQSEGQGEGESEDSSSSSEPPRVRACACISLVAGLELALADSGLEPARLDPLARLVVGCLARIIADDRTPLVATIACEQAAAVSDRLARSDPALGLVDLVPELAGQLARALHECLIDERRSAAVHDAAAAAIEALDESVRTERARWTRALRGAVAAVPPGGRRRVPIPHHPDDPDDPDGPDAGPSDLELARVFAAITRDDWGVDVDRRGRASLVVRRGDHRTTRLWRILHELRHPAGNKRQAFRHTTGRRLVGRLRAHPSRLDEVTATVVPGERVHIEAEGGWGRHLPTVDDLLGLPWLRGSGGAEREVLIASSHGLTRLRLLGDLGQRLRARARLNLDYAALAELRRRALLADEPSERRRYADELRARYQIELSFEPHPSVIPDRPVPARLRALFGRGAWARSSVAAEIAEVDFELGERETAKAQAQASTALLPVAFAAPQLGEGLRAWMRGNLHYFLTLEGNSQQALGLFALGLAGYFLGAGYIDRRRIATARAAIPLSIGGWGTRGKSGTERLKAGLFHGLGFRTFAKTTGCEAMFLHAAPLGPQVEIYTFRPYGKATIWEQRDLVQLAAALETEVFLWECMALNPEYVDILQRGWMRDDIATITNTYPDHEDIQGPAGIDVATVISRFIPDRRLVISSELAFNPVLRDRARERKAEMIEIGDHAGDLLAEDLLALFPYAEHPRNIALVTSLARELGIDEELAIVTMADHVVPDLGVLAVYPEVVVRGRRLVFINGCSANERAGFINNWTRTGCDRIAAAADPAAMVITVVNNRDDRVSRSEVFSRILVNDVSVDAHVLIGSNLAGLSVFIDRALEVYCRSVELLDSDALTAGGQAHARARTRLRTLLDRVRAPVDRWAEALSTLSELGLAALGRRFDPDAAASQAVREQIAALREHDGSLEFDAVVTLLERDAALTRAIRELHDRAGPADPSRTPGPELGRPPSLDEFVDHLRARCARMIIAARLSTKLERVLASRDPAALALFMTTLTRAWTALFKAQLVFVWDPAASGDQIIEQCARAVPPGVHVSIMGTQNIKGTGLDFIYRWQALDAVHKGLTKLETADDQARLEVLRGLDSHSDFGFTDTGLLAARLAELSGGPAQEQALRSALLDKVSAVHRSKLAQLDSTGADRSSATRTGRLLRSLETWVDFIDGAVRHRQSRQLVDDLIDFRVSHNKMAVEMRELYARAKGGWLSKALGARMGRRRKRRAKTD